MLVVVQCAYILQVNVIYTDSYKKGSSPTTLLWLFMCIHRFSEMS